MGIDRSDLHALLDRVPEADLAVTRKLLRALAPDWDVAPAETEGQFTDQAKQDVEAAEAYFDRGGGGLPHKEILDEFDLA
jgi:hypothetical protein